MFYASADDTVAATTAMSTNGQLLIGNATNGYPSVATLTVPKQATLFYFKRITQSNTKRYFLKARHENSK